MVYSCHTVTTTGVCVCGTGRGDVLRSTIPESKSVFKSMFKTMTPIKLKQSEEFERIKHQVYALNKLYLLSRWKYLPLSKGHTPSNKDYNVCFISASPVLQCEKITRHKNRATSHCDKEAKG